MLWGWRHASALGHSSSMDKDLGTNPSQSLCVGREGGREMFSSFLYLSAKASPLRNCGNARPSTQLVPEEQALSTLECQLVHQWPFRILPLSALNPQSGQTLVSAECTGKKCGEGFPVCPAAPPHSPCCTPTQNWFPAHLIWGQLVHHDINAARWAKCKLHLGQIMSRHTVTSLVYIHWLNMSWW